MQIDKKHLKSVVENRTFNTGIAKYYTRLSEEFKHDVGFKFLNKRNVLLDCNAMWLIDKYELQKVKDFKKTNLCKDKFCNNCKKVKQASRLSKFQPLLEPFKENMYQLTLTVPNCRGEDLKATIDKILKNFGRLVEFLKGKKKVAGVDFEIFGYEGAIRSLEITIPKSNEYHPHLHALFVFKDYEGYKQGNLIHKNSYSYNKKKKGEVRKFSNEEILIQKIWRLMFDGVKVTKKNIDQLDIGYSCRIDKFKENDYLELFKYMTKSTTEYDKMISYNQFKTLYFALDGRRQIQGYGCFYGLKDDDEISVEEIDDYYNGLLEQLQQKEKPIEVSEAPIDLLKDDEYILISRKKIYSHLKKLNK